MTTDRSQPADRGRTEILAYWRDVWSFVRRFPVADVHLLRCEIDVAPYRQDVVIRPAAGKLLQCVDHPGAPNHQELAFRSCYDAPEAREWLAVARLLLSRAVECALIREGVV